MRFALTFADAARLNAIAGFDGGPDVAVLSRRCPLTFINPSLLLLLFLLCIDALHRLCVPDAHYANLLRFIVVYNARFTYPQFRLP